MTQSTFLVSNSIQKGLSVGEYKNKARSVIISVQHSPNLQPSAGGKRSCIDLLLQHSRIWGMLISGEPIFFCACSSKSLWQFAEERKEHLFIQPLVVLLSERFFTRSKNGKQT